VSARQVNSCCLAYELKDAPEAYGKRLSGLSSSVASQPLVSMRHLAQHTEMVGVSELSFTIDVDALVIMPTLTRNFSFAGGHLEAGPYAPIYTVYAGRKRVVRLVFVGLRIAKSGWT